jgi:hypothetical protein
MTTAKKILKQIDQEFYQEINGIPTLTGNLRPKLIRFVQSSLASQRQAIEGMIQAVENNNPFGDGQGLAYRQAMVDLKLKLKEI